MSDMNWRDKDDLDLTSEDIDAMIAEGRPMAVRGPAVPGGKFIVCSTTLGVSTVSQPEPARGAGTSASARHRRSGGSD